MQHSLSKFLAGLLLGASLLFGACSPSSEEDQVSAGDESTAPADSQATSTQTDSTSDSSREAASGDIAEARAFGKLNGMMFAMGELSLTEEDADIIAQSFKKFVMGGKSIDRQGANAIRKAQQYFGQRKGTEDPEPVEPEQLRNLGMLIAAVSGVLQMDMTEGEVNAFAEGMKSVTAEPLDEEAFNKTRETVAQWAPSRMPKPPEPSQETVQASKEFFERIDAREDVQKTSSGLRYIIATSGEGDSPTVSDEVSVKYKGKLMDGTVFDQSKEGRPVTFPIQGVIKGFGEGIQLLHEGGKATLFIPANLAYGNNPPKGSPIPPGSPLVFDIELVDVR